MRTTKHAGRRIRQRGFSEFTLEIVRKHGHQEGAPGGAIRIFFGRKEYQRTVQELKRAIQMLDRAKGGAMIVQDGDLLTVYKR